MTTPRVAENRRMLRWVPTEVLEDRVFHERARGRPAAAMLWAAYYSWLGTLRAELKRRVA